LSFSKIAKGFLLLKETKE